MNHSPSDDERLTHLARTQPSSSRGSAYVFVLVVSMVVTLIGVATVTASRIATRKQSRNSDWQAARILAGSGMDYALLRVQEAVETLGVNWRDAFASGLVSPPVTLGSGTFVWKIEDADSNLGDDLTDPFDVIVRAQVNQAAYQLRLEMAPTASGFNAVPLDSLEVALVCHQIDFDGSTINADNIIHSNSSVSVSDSQCNADVHAEGTIGGNGSYNGINNSGAANRRMPQNSAFNYYLSQGTPINYSDLVAGRLENIVLSPFNNPYGATNAEGIYVINCNGDDIYIQGVRIVGTVVMVNVSKVWLRQQINWEPAYGNYPALMVDGKLFVEMDDQPLSESDRGTNFNPTGTPFQNGTDADINDYYPNAIAGVSYVTDDVQILDAWTLTVEGVLIGKKKFLANPGATINVLYRDTAFNDPPPGFRESNSGPPAVTAGSVEQLIP